MPAMVLQLVAIKVTRSNCGISIVLTSITSNDIETKNYAAVFHVVFQHFTPPWNGRT